MLAFNNAAISAVLKKFLCEIWNLLLRLLLSHRLRCNTNQETRLDSYTAQTLVHASLGGF